jgi:hypothetical protein
MSTDPSDMPAADLPEVEEPEKVRFVALAFRNGYHLTLTLKASVALKCIQLISDALVARREFTKAPKKRWWQRPLPPVTGPSVQFLSLDDEPFLVLDLDEVLFACVGDKTDE